VSFVLPILRDFDYVASHSNISTIRHFVWKDSIYQAGHLENAQIAFSANTGFIASRLEAMPFDWIVRKAEEGVALREHMALSCMEQPLINYLIVTSGKKYTSLFLLFYEKRYAGIKLETWGGNEGLHEKNGNYFNQGDEPVFLLHWAGIWRPQDGGETGINANLPYKDLWASFRNM
jgi:hypothetical protein